LRGAAARFWSRLARIAANPSSVIAGATCFGRLCMRLCTGFLAQSLSKGEGPQVRPNTLALEMAVIGVPISS
jgi:hypothetical protein